MSEDTERKILGGGGRNRTVCCVARLVGALLNQDEWEMNIRRHALDAFPQRAASRHLGRFPFGSRKHHHFTVGVRLNRKPPLRLGWSHKLAVVLEDDRWRVATFQGH